MTAASQRSLADVWWLVLLEGIAMLILGILLVTNTGITLVTLVIFIGIYWLIDGIFSIIRIFVGSGNIGWGWLLFRGVIGIIAGLLVIQHPLWASFLLPVVLVIILGIWGIQGDGVWAGVLGVIYILFGIILLANRYLSALVLPLSLGILGIIGGIILIIQSFRIKAAA